ncbi:uncharacterized protein [Nerophis lumbriciformis]|uniref:uncharacterized protein n=1 Tax=Nerophis lumbriciformis TaxID=546530 RepID=UPI002ADFB2D3|nr:G-protein-signaling modulator 2-like [Nerophis lumbriciformis]XP_061839061.1 G-protein-signaling modulator 2-like [Nerophis lumbriciformis]
MALVGAQAEAKEGVAQRGEAEKLKRSEEEEEKKDASEEDLVDVDDLPQDASDARVPPPHLYLGFKPLSREGLLLGSMRSKEEEDAKQARRLTPDFPDALYELLCTLQEGRRLNDQRCSFRLEGAMRRRCHSEPSVLGPGDRGEGRRVIFSSMTSLQREEFFELVATAQARRLDDQRAHLQRLPRAKPKTRSFRGSLKQLSLPRRPQRAAPVPKEDLYNMILTTQAQGRLEDQRSRAPGPMDDEDFFSLLLRVQGGRMDEQRTELPNLLQT